MHYHHLVVVAAHTLVSCWHLLTLLPATNSAPGLEMKKTEIDSELLCETRPARTCLEEEFKLRECLDQAELLEECSLLSIATTTSLTAVMLDSIFATADTDSLVRQIQIRSAASVDVAEVSKLIDSAMAKRPGWEVTVEPFSWREENENLVVFERYSPRYDSYFKLLEKIQFPANTEVCSKTPLHIGRGACVNPSLGGQMGRYTRLKPDYPFQIITVYIPKTMHNKLGFISKDDITTANAWEAAFLPTTDCEIPQYALDCKYGRCIEEQNNNVGGGTLSYCALNNCSMVPRISEFIKRDTLFRSLMRSPHSNEQQTLVDAGEEPQKAKKFLYKKPEKWYEGNIVDIPADLALFDWHMLARPNAFYRSQAAQLIDTYRTKNKGQSFVLEKGQDCTVVHLRKGERFINDQIDIFQWCKNMSKSRYDEHQVCLTRNMEHKKCDYDEGTDWGCDTYPFTAVTLSQALEKVPFVAGAGQKTVLVLVDDHSWIQSEISRLSEKIKKFDIKLFPNEAAIEAAKEAAETQGVPTEEEAGEERTHGYTRDSGTVDGVHLFASMQLAQQCNAFIGHLAVPVTHNFYASLCVNKAGGARGMCPPSFNLGLLRSEFKEKLADPREDEVQNEEEDNRRRLRRLSHHHQSPSKVKRTHK